MSENLVVVTGAGGFIGSNVLSALAVEGRNVVACDTFSHDESWAYLAPSLVYDAVDAGSLLPWLNANVARVDAIVHLGAISATTETNVARIVATNIRLTLDLWTYAVQNDKAFIYASSAATYGDGSQGFTDDDAPTALAKLKPLNPYGWSKHFVDRRIMDDVVNGRPTPTRWAGLKFFNVYGPNEAHKGPMRSVVHQIYPATARGEVVRLFKSDNQQYPDGGQLRDFIYVKDCSSLILNILRLPAISGIFNAGTGQARTFEDLARAVFTAAGQEASIEYIDMPPQLRGRYQYFTQADSAKLKAHDLAPDFYSLEDGIADYVREHLVHEFAGT